MDLLSRDYLVVGVDKEQFGLDVQRVNTVVEYRRPALIPGRPVPFLGALNHHGELLPVAHLAVLIGKPPRVDPLRSVIVVADWEEALVGLLVERSFGLLTPFERTRPAHVLGRWEGPHLLQTLEVENRRVHVLDLDSLLDELGRRL